MIWQIFILRFKDIAIPAKVLGTGEILWPNNRETRYQMVQFTYKGSQTHENWGAKQ